MQLFYIRTRDDLCKNGEVLLTPALSYTERHLQAALEIERMEKSEAEQREDEEKKRGGESEETPQETGVGVCVGVGGGTYLWGEGAMGVLEIERMEK